VLPVFFVDDHGLGFDALCGDFKEYRAEREQGVDGHGAPIQKAPTVESQIARGVVNVGIAVDEAAQRQRPERFVKVLQGERESIQVSTKQKKQETLESHRGLHAWPTCGRWHPRARRRVEASWKEVVPQRKFSTEIRKRRFLQKFFGNLIFGHLFLSISGRRPKGFGKKS
jgi:hypothetical protein